MFQLRHLRTFVAAAETLNFTRAAERVHLAQPSVTEQVRALEDLVGRPLFLRRHNALALTAAGSALLGRARDLLAMADEALREAKRDDEPAPLIISAPEALATSVLAPLAADHARQWPSLRVSLRIRNSAETVADVGAGAAGLGLLHGTPSPDDGLASQLLTHDRAVVVMLPSHAMAARDRVGSADLIGLSLGATVPGCAYRAYLDAMRRSHGLSVAFEADSVGALLALVTGGLGVCVVPRLAFLGAAQASVLVARALADVPPLPVSVVCRRSPTSDVDAFARILHAHAHTLDEAMSALDV